MGETGVSGMNFDGWCTMMDGPEFFGLAQAGTYADGPGRAAWVGPSPMGRSVHLWRNHAPNHAMITQL